MFSLCGMVALHNLCWNPLIFPPDDSYCKNMWLRTMCCLQSKFEPITHFPLLTKHHPPILGANVTTWKQLYLSVVCCCRVLFLPSFTVGVDLSKSTTCLHFHALIYSKYDIVKRFPHTYATLNNSLGNTIIPNQRLVTMSVSLCTQTGLCHLILQVLNIKSLLPKCLIQSLSLMYIII